MRGWPWLITLTVGLNLPIIAVAPRFASGSCFFIGVGSLALIPEAVINLEQGLGIRSKSDRCLPRVAASLMIAATIWAAVEAFIVRENLWAHMIMAIVAPIIIALFYWQILKLIGMNQTARP